jgi:hypothetical protein
VKPLDELRDVRPDDHLFDSQAGPVLQQPLAPAKQIRLRNPVL